MSRNDAGEMKYWMFLDASTGQIEKGCSSCGFLSSNSMSEDDLDIYPLHEDHKILEVSEAEFMALQETVLIVERDGQEIRLESPLDFQEGDNPIGTEAAMLPDLDALGDIKLQDRIKLSDRPIVEAPIEAEGIGGKEIIGYETKPVVIVIERELSTKKEEAGRD